MLKSISIRRDGGFGDMLMIFTLFNSLKNKGFEVDFRCSTHWNHKFLNQQNFIDKVSDNFKTIDIDLYDNEHREEYRQSHVFESFKHRIESYVTEDLDVELFKLNFIEKDEKLVSKFLQKIKKPIILINAKANVLNRSLTDSNIENICVELNSIGTVININNNYFVENEKVINIFKDVFNPDISLLACLINQADILVTTNTGTMHLGNCMHKKVVSIDQTFYSSKYNIYNNPNFEIISSNLECLGCESHGGCKIDNNVGTYTKKDENDKIHGEDKYPLCSIIEPHKVVKAVNNLINN